MTHKDDVADVPPRLLKWPLFLMIQVMREAGRLRDLEYPTERLRFAHHGVMACLADEGALAQKDVALRLRIDPSDLVKVVDLLEEEGLVTRTRDPHDRRRQLLDLTDAGRITFAERELVLDEANAFLLAPLSPEERVQFEEMLRKMRASLVSRLQQRR